MFVGRSQEIKIHKSKKDLSYVFLNSMPFECGAPAVSYTGNNEASDKQCRLRRRIDNKSILFHDSPSLPVAIVCAFMQCLRGADVLNVGYATVFAAAALFSGQSECIATRNWAWNNIPDLRNGFGSIARAWKKSYKPMRNPSLR